MSMMKIAMHAVTATKVLVTTITALGTTTTPTGAESPLIPTLRAATASELRSIGAPVPGRPYPIDRIPPQYLPAQSSHPRAARGPMATPVEVRNLSELRWRRFARLRSL